MSTSHLSVSCARCYSLCYDNAFLAAHRLNSSQSTLISHRLPHIRVLNQDIECTALLIYFLVLTCNVNLGLFSSHRTMTSSISNTSQISGKSLSVSSHTPIQQQTQATAPAFESSSRRSSSHSGSSFAAPRNNQSSKKKHRNQRRPQLGDEDAFAESVSSPCITWKHQG